MMSTRIVPRQNRNSPVIEVLDDILGPQLSVHCRIKEIQNGRLTILVDSPSYLYELNLCRDELLEEIRAHCPRCPVRNIQFIAG